MTLPTHKTTTVRLPADVANELEDVAAFDGVAVAQEIREAVELLIKERKSDPAFRARVHAAAARSRSMLERLEGGEAVAEALDGTATGQVGSAEFAETGR